MSTPSMTFPLVANPNPLSLDAGPLGKVYITGALTGLGLTQNNAGPPICNSCDKSSVVDMSNGQIFVQKTTGLVQFFLEGGGYSFPTIGQPYVRSGDATNDTFGIFPVGYLKLAPGNGSFSIEAGKLPTLFGAEYSFTFENPNIERGLLWNQENIVTRGVQANYTSGPLAFSLSWNDGYYTKRYNWVTGSAAWTINSANTVSVVAGGLYAGATTADVASLDMFGRKAGLAFQIVDDVLDMTVDSAHLGKTAGKDLATEKATWPAVYGIEQSQRDAAELIKEAFAALAPYGSRADGLKSVARYLVERKN